MLDRFECIYVYIYVYVYIFIYIFIYIYVYINPSCRNLNIVFNEIKSNKKLTI